MYINCKAFPLTAKTSPLTAKVSFRYEAAGEARGAGSRRLRSEPSVQGGCQRSGWSGLNPSLPGCPTTGLMASTTCESTCLILPYQGLGSVLMPNSHWKLALPFVIQEWQSRWQLMIFFPQACNGLMWDLFPDQRLNSGCSSENPKS